MQLIRLFFAERFVYIMIIIIILVTCKERSPRVLDDFLYICDDSFNRNELIAMERKILIGRDFDLGIPLSYSFLRRYAKVTKLFLLQFFIKIHNFMQESIICYYVYFSTVCSSVN